MSEKIKYKTKIEGKDYTIVGERSKEHLDQVIEVMTTQFAQLRDLAPDLSLTDRSILMAINAISDQYLKERHIMELEETNRQLQKELEMMREKHQTLTNSSHSVLERDRTEIPFHRKNRK